MSERRTAMEVYDDQIEGLRRRAISQWEVDQMFHQTVRQAVALAMQRHGPIDRRDADRAAHDIATDVAAIVLKAVYEDDGLVKQLAAERDRYRKMAEEAISLRPQPMFIPKASEP